MNDYPIVGVIGGSGLYDMPGLENKQTLTIDTPFGSPSAPVIIGLLDGKKVAFLARHGIGHNISPSEINFRANIYALKSLGIQRVVSISACGSLREDYAPGHIVIPDQIFDFTHKRTRSFFGEGLVAHVGVADPFCQSLSNQVFSSLVNTGATVHQGGTLITIEGPRFSTRGESLTYRAWGMSIIGMTACPEVFLAREAEMCYMTMAHVTDYDVWHVSEQPVTVEIVIRTLIKNTEIAQSAIRNLVNTLSSPAPCECQNALSSAIITQREHIPDETIQKLGIIVKKYIQS